MSNSQCFMSIIYDIKGTRISGPAVPLILVVNLRHTLEGGDYTRTYRFIYIDCPNSGKHRTHKSIRYQLQCMNLDLLNRILL